MSRIFYMANGEVANISLYPDYEKTKYLNIQLIKNKDRRLPSLYEKKEDCCGCFTCYSICPKDAIYMEEDLEGFVYPVIDVSNCIQCYQCEKVCPIKTIDLKKRDIKNV